MTIRTWSALYLQEARQKHQQNALKTLGDSILGRVNSSLKLAFATSAILIAGLVAIPSASAVGLGEITVNSSLNEPLSAHIDIINSTDLEDNQILVSLASDEAFERAGVSRDFFLSRLQFSVSRDSSNQRIINIVTQQPVVEPYLDFLVQLQWPEGRVMRSYTLLLDLPIYRQDQTSAVQVAPPVSRNEPAEQGTRRGPAPAAVAPTGRIALSGDQHQVIVGDTLWNVAKRLRPRGTTILQTMDSLYEQNATAFSGGDANRLMEGSVLRLPSRDEISEQVGDRVASQIGLVAPSDPAGQIAANDDIEIIYSDEYDAEPASAQLIETDARLKLVSASEQSSDKAAKADAEDLLGADSAAAANTSGREVAQQLSSDLAIANDEVNKVQLENSELRERLALLEAQVATMAALVEQAQKQGEIDRETVVPSKSEDNLSASLLAVPAYFWAAVIGLILLLAVLVMRRSSASKRDDGDLDDLSMGSYESYDKGAPSNATAAATLHELDDLELDPEDDLFDETDAEIFDSLEETVNEEVFDMMVEAVAEAEVYLSLGNTPQAIAVLEDARVKDLTDASCRLKLMEILFREGRKDELRPLYEEIVLTEDSTAIEMAAIITGPKDGSITSLEEGASDLDLDSLEPIEGLEPIDSPEPDDSPEAIEGPELDDSPEPIEGHEPDDSPELDDSPAPVKSSDTQHPELQDLGFSDAELNTFDLEDLDIDSLDIQDFDIEVDESPQESTVLQFPGGEELANELDEAFADFDEELAAVKNSAAENSEQESSDKEGSDIESFDIEGSDVEGSDVESSDVENSATEEFSALDDIDSLDAADIKLDLANTYIEMGDPEGAKEILEELLGEADSEGQAKAQTLLDSLVAKEGK